MAQGSGAVFPTDPPQIAASGALNEANANVQEVPVDDNLVMEDLVPEVVHMGVDTSDLPVYAASPAVVPRSEAVVQAGNPVTPPSFASVVKPGRDWLKNAQAALGPLPKFTGTYSEEKALARAAKQFRFHLRSVMDIADVPPEKERWVAMNLLGGDAYDLACDLSVDGDPDLDSILALVDSLVTGSSLGPVLTEERVQAFSYFATLRKHFTKSGELYNIGHITNQHRKVFNELTDPIAETTKCCYIQNSIGFKRLANEVRLVTNEKGRRSEIKDSEQMFTCLLAHNDLWLQLAREKLIAEGLMTAAGKKVQQSDVASGSNVKGHNGGGWKKAKASNQQSKGSGFAHKPGAFNPFKVYKGQCKPRPEGASTQLWMSVPVHVKNSRKQQGVCIACGNGKHVARECPKAAQLFESKDYCFHPPKPTK